jgi:hypothetical protein
MYFDHDRPSVPRIQRIVVSGSSVVAGARSHDSMREETVAIEKGRDMRVQLQDAVTAGCHEEATTSVVQIDTNGLACTEVLRGLP